MNVKELNARAFVWSVAVAASLLGAGIAIAARPASHQTLGAGRSITWRGVTLGEPISNLRRSFGDPIRTVWAMAVIAHSHSSAPRGLVRGPFARIPGWPITRRSRVRWFWIPGSDFTFFTASSENGYVTAFEAFLEGEDPSAPLLNVPADPSGVRLGDTMQSVEAIHPEFHPQEYDPGLYCAGHCASGPFYVMRGRGPLPNVEVMYEFDAGRVADFTWYLTSAPQPPLAEPPEPDGESTRTALLDVQRDEEDGVNWERLYIANQFCDNGGEVWQIQSQSLMEYRGRAYDRVHVVCPGTSGERDFYFDISSYFGKL